MQTNDYEDDQAPSVEPPADTQSRGAFDIRAKSKAGGDTQKKLILGIAAMVLVFLSILIGGWFLVISKMTSGTTEVDETTVKPDASLEVQKGKDDSMAKARAEQLRKLKDEEDAKKAQEELDRQAWERDQQNKPGANPAPGNIVPGSGNGPRTENTTVSPMQRKLGVGLVVSPVLQDVSTYGAAGTASKEAGEGNGRQPLSMAELDAAAGGTGELGGAPLANNTRGSLSRLSGTTFAPARAYLAPNRKYLLSHNTYTRCALYTEIVTDHPGMVDCRLTGPLYSADGSTVIADAGDRLTGEQTVSVAAGQSTVFAIWTELETQSGVRAKLDSLGAGPMGASGIKAWMDRHLLQKYSGAVMLSAFQDVLQSAANSTQKGGSGSGYTINNSEQNVEGMAEKALDSTINIADTGHVLPGTVITVIIARDIDFSSVFENR